jgi:hypothetical protein
MKPFKEIKKMKKEIEKEETLSFLIENRRVWERRIDSLLFFSYVLFTGYIH